MKNNQNTVKFLLGILILCGLGICVAPVTAKEIVGRGDFTFYVDTASFRAENGRIMEEIYVRIPNNEIGFESGQGEYRAKLRISVRITDTRGNPVIEDAGLFDFTEDSKDRAESPLYFQTLIKRYLIESGVYQLSYAIEDLNEQKRTVLGLVRDKYNTSAARGNRIVVPEISSDIASFSTPMFLWSIDKPGENSVYHPNPPRMYGLHKDTLLVYLELYLPEEMALEPSFEFKSNVLDVDGKTMADRTVTLPNPDASRGGTMKTYPIVIKEDLSAYPAGLYFLNFSFGLEKQILNRIRAGSFSVAWDMRTWEVPRRHFLAEARFLLGDGEFDVFQGISLGEQERMLDSLWVAEDPSPETGINEAYEKFLERLEYVNENYSGGFGMAIFSDRGSVYMKWGPPEELIQDSMPVNRETLSEAFATIENKYHPVNYSTHGVKPYHNATRSNDIDPRRLGQVGEGGNTGCPFEVWIYNGPGDPILTRHRTYDPEISSRYLFIDKDGYGVYKLETSTRISEK